MSWSCCKEDSPDHKPQPINQPKLPPKVKSRDAQVAYILKHEEDEEEQPQAAQPQAAQPQAAQPQVAQPQAARPQAVQPQAVQPQASSGQDDDAAASTSANEENDAKEAGTQTNPHYFIRSPGRVTLDEILRGIQRIQLTMEHMLTDFEQRISRLEKIVLKMRNAWIHHRTCHLEGLEYDDEQED